MIEVHNVHHHYGTAIALDSVSVHVPRGAVVGLVGPNGAGKTTLVRAIGTLLRHTRGVIRVAGHDTLRDPEKVRQKLGYLPERANPYPELMAWEHLDLFARIAGHTAAERAKRVDAGLDAAGLLDRRETPTAALSKGLRQRLALQATLLHDPVAIVLDEPTDGLDPDSRAGLLETARRLADGGAAVLLSNHVLQELEEVADEVVILSGGRVQQEEEAPAGLRFTVRTQAPVAPELLAEVPGIARVEAEGDVLHVSLEPGVADASAVVTALVRAGAAVVEVRHEAVTLRQRYDSAVAPTARGETS
jgi:ABC-2 type transport system ATP-binding protein